MKESERYEKAQQDLGWKLLHKAGFDGPMDAPETVDAVLSGGA